MSNPEHSAARPDKAAMAELESVVGQALSRLAELRSRAEEAEARSTELEELLRRFTGDEGEAGRLLTRLRTLEAENTDLRNRVAQGREGVERMLARLRFLEEQR